MKTFLALLCLIFLIQDDSPMANFSNEHMVLEYPEDWVIRPIENTAKVNYILETEKLSIWSPLKPDQDRKTLKLTVASSIYYKKQPAIKRIDKEILKAAKAKHEDFERISTDQGVKGDTPYIKTTFSSKSGALHEITEYYVFSVKNTPYVLYMTSSRKEHIGQQKVWDTIWSSLSLQ